MHFRAQASTCGRAECEHNLLNDPLDVHLPGVRLLDYALHRDLPQAAHSAQRTAHSAQRTAQSQAPGR